MAINDAFLSELKMRTDITDLVSSYTSLDSRRQGRTHKGLYCDERACNKTGKTGFHCRGT